MYYRKRIRNRILQKLYRPRRKANRLLPSEVMDALGEIDRAIEERVTPLLDEILG